MDDPSKPSQFWINEVGVAPGHQGRGIGKALMYTMLEHAIRSFSDAVRRRPNRPAVEVDTAAVITGLD